MEKCFNILDFLVYRVKVMITKGYTCDTNVF